ncbi:MAG: HAD family phosphatase [Bacteroidetes bacterium]|nr:HAD family phosphatase [Bacteroidota bacterium]
MDGVLIDSEPAYRKMNMEHFSELGFEMSEEEYNGFVGMSSFRMWDRIKSDYDLEHSVEELMESEKMRMYSVLSSDMISTPVSGINELILSFERSNFRLSVASSSPRDNIQLVLNKHGLNIHFDYIISGEEVLNGKPAPDIFLKTAEHFKVKPDSCYVIEDSANGVKAAKSAGMNCIAYINPNSGNQDVSDADLSVESFSDEEIIKILTFIKNSKA